MGIKIFNSYNLLFSHCYTWGQCVLTYRRDGSWVLELGWFLIFSFENFYSEYMFPLRLKFQFKSFY